MSAVEKNATGSAFAVAQNASNSNVQSMQPNSKQHPQSISLASPQPPPAPSSSSSASKGVEISSGPKFYRVPLQHHSSGGYLQFGEYRLMQTLGEGEFGKVKLAVDGNGQEYAVKFIRKSLLANPDFKAKLYREIEIMQILNSSPFIVRLLDVLECEKYVGLVMEYASGGELFNHILARRFLAEREARRYFAQLILGVHELHSMGIVHRDLKLENLLLDSARNIKISDFGFANRSATAAISDDNLLMRTSCGSPCYAAPELVLADERYDGRAADIWSCGIILFAMLAGYLPFDDDPRNPGGQNVAKLYQYILRAKVRYPEHIGNGDARNLINLILVPDPRKRATLQQIMTHKWIADEITELQITAAALKVPVDCEQQNDDDENRASMANQVSTAKSNKLTLLISPTAVLRSFITQHRRPRAHTLATVASNADSTTLFTTESAECKAATARLIPSDSNDIPEIQHSPSKQCQSAGAVENPSGLLISSSPCRKQSTGSAEKSPAGRFFENFPSHFNTNNLFTESKRRFLSLGRANSSSSPTTSITSSTAISSVPSITSTTSSQHSSSEKIAKPKVLLGSGVIDKRTVSATLSPKELLQLFIRRIQTLNAAGWSGIKGGGSVKFEESSNATNDPFSINCIYHSSVVNLPLSLGNSDDEDYEEDINNDDNNHDGEAEGAVSFQKSLKLFITSNWRRLTASNSLMAGSRQQSAIIRFSAQVCRVGGLEDVYCLEIRRLKGNAWQYKRIYEAIIDPWNLSSSTTENTAITTATTDTTITNTTI